MMRNIFRKKDVVDPRFSKALESLGKQTTDIRAFDLMEGWIQLHRDKAAESPDVIELRRYRGDFSDEQWREHMDFDRFVEIAKALGETSLPFRVIPSEATRPFDYDADENAG